MKATKTWILVANASKARLFESEDSKMPVEVQQFDHPAGHMRNQDLVSDRSSCCNDTSHMGGHSREPKHSPKELEEAGFAKALAGQLQKAQNEGKFQKLYLVASPHLLGLLRQEIHPNVAKICVGDVHKDLTHSSVSEIREHLPFVL